jgi:hypothetical protein
VCSPVVPEDLTPTATATPGKLEKNIDLKWELSPADAILGQALSIFCPALRVAGSKVVIWIMYEVRAESSSAVQILGPELTASKKYPFLFTQCQAIHARALCPCQVSCPATSCIVLYKSSNSATTQDIAPCNAFQPHWSKGVSDKP